MGLLLVARKAVTPVNPRVTRLPFDLYLNPDEPVFIFNCITSRGLKSRELIIILHRHKEQIYGQLLKLAL